MRSRGKILFLILLALVFLLLFKIDLNGQILESKATIIEIVNQEQAQNPESTIPQWTLLDNILEPDPEFDNVELFVGAKDIIYYEEVPARDKKGQIRKDKNGNVILRKIRQRNPEREIGLKLLNTQTGEATAIKIRRRGSDLMNPPGYTVEVIERPNGIKWNAHNTYYRIVEPENMVVIRNAYPSAKTVKEKRVVENKIYVPYSQEIGTLEIIPKGREDLKTIVAHAKDRLRQNNVVSQAFPDRLVADILPDEFYRRRAIMERTDLGEIIIDPKETVNMFFTILATNQSNAFSNCNSVPACGMYQFTDKGKSGTYRTVRRNFPKADLIQDFRTGTLDHVNSAMAAMLLDDLNLASLVRRYGSKIYDDPKLEEYLAASYNGAPRWVNKSLDATLAKNVTPWGKYLKDETDGFLVKLDILKRLDI